MDGMHVSHRLDGLLHKGSQGSLGSLDLICTHLGLVRIRIVKNG